LFIEKSRENRKNKDDMQNNKGKGMNGLDSPEKGKKEEIRKKKVERI
jgi:hypothetical protein